MTMNKVIHGAVRRDLQRFLDASERFTVGDTARAAALGRAWDNFDLQLTHHHEGEHENAWPAMLELGVQQQQVDTFDAEHEAMAGALAKTRGAMTSFRQTASAEDTAALRDALTTLQQVTETHLANEEGSIEQLMLDQAEHPAVIAMGKKFGKVSPSVGGTFFTWIQDGNTPEEQAALEAFVPKPVMKILGGIWGRDYRKNVAPVWRG